MHAHGNNGSVYQITPFVGEGSVVLGAIDI